MSDRRKKPIARAAVQSRTSGKPKAAAEPSSPRAEKAPSTSAAKEKILRALKKLHPME